MAAGTGFVYLDIAESIRRLVVSGELQPGDRLPSVRDMAERWRCTPNTVNRAYSQLAREGLVSSRRGGGTRVASQTAGFGVGPPPEWQWASLINRAETYLLEAISQGHSAAHAEAALAAAIARWQELRRRAPAQASSHPSPDAATEPGGTRRLHFAGSHDLSVELLARFLSEMPEPVTLTADFVGSLGGLIALARREADIAGSHLWDEGTRTYNVAYIQRVLPNRGVMLINLVQRVQGLIVPSGNPQALTAISDLVQPGVIFVNRQSGSGTRVWLDFQLKSAGLPASGIPGYDREESTHMAVARAVAEGRATAGLGIGAAAAAYGLDFVPLGKERYDLVIPLESWDVPQIALLRSVLSSPGFREAVSALGGYDVSQTGNETRVG
jgi:molybdate-binding protein/DNA-binding transcriptional regulator YhcF (GntR family)